MNAPRKKSSRRKRKPAAARTAPPAEFWRSAPEPPEPPDITPTSHATALLRSMGTPPLTGHHNSALPYLEAVVLEAQKSATALAASADLLDLGQD